MTEFLAMIFTFHYVSISTDCEVIKLSPDY